MTGIVQMPAEVTRCAIEGFGYEVMRTISVGAGNRSYVNCEERRGVVNRGVKQISKKREEKGQGKGGMMLRRNRWGASGATSRAERVDLPV